MPKRMVSGGGVGEDLLPAWQATGLALAVIGSRVLNGFGVLVFGLISIGVIWVLHRLHRHARQSPSTADLIGSVLGAAPARAVGVIQFVAYILIGAYTAKGIGLLALTLTPDPVAASTGWLWAASSMAAVGVAGVAVAWLPTRALAPVVAVLAAFGLLVFFYVALAVLAKIGSGTIPVETGAPPASSELGVIGVVIPLAIALAAFEIPTAASDRLRSVGRPLGWAMALVAVCAATAVVATNVGTSGPFRFDAGELVWTASEMFGESSGLWMLAASVALATATLVVLIWGATRVAPSPIPRATPGVLVVTVVTTLLAVAMCRDWGDVSAKLWGVGAILLFAIYVIAAQANSRLDDGNTVAWALFALMCVVLGVVVFVQGAGSGWWPVGIAVAIVAVAAALAVRSDRVSPESRKA